MWADNRSIKRLVLAAVLVFTVGCGDARGKHFKVTFYPGSGQSKTWTAIGRVRCVGWNRWKFTDQSGREVLLENGAIAVEEIWTEVDGT